MKDSTSVSQSQGLRFVAIERNPLAVSFARTLSDDGRTRIVRISRVPIPLWPKSRQSRGAVTSWARWRLEAALSGGRLMSGLSLTPEEAGRMIHHLEERIQRLEALITGQAEEVIALLTPWRQTQARINVELWQEIQNVKQMLSSNIRVPTGKN